MDARRKTLFMRATACMMLTVAVVLLWGGRPQPVLADEMPAPLLSAGGYHTCILALDGSADCWGDNDGGQAEDQDGPFMQIETGEYHTCALTLGGAAVCWGDNSFGQTVGNSGPFIELAVGNNYNCGLLADGSVDCWGGDNDWGEVTDQTGPFTQITAGTNHVCALKPDRTIACWGTNKYSQTDHPAGEFTQLSAGWDHTCGLRVDGSIACWGRNESGQLDAPQGFFAHVSAGKEHNCGLKVDGSTVCWGLNLWDQADPPASRFRSISAGDLHTCGLRFFGSVECWGASQWNQSDDQPGPYGQLIGPPLALNDRYHTGRETRLDVGLPGVLTNDANAIGDPQVYFLSPDGHIQILAWFNDRWHQTDLTAYTGVPPVWSNALTSTTVGGDPRIYFIGTDEDLHELAWTGDPGARDWYHGNLSYEAAAPPPNGPFLSATTVNSAPRLYYVGQYGHVHELAWIVDEWLHVDVTTSAGATPADGDSQLAATSSANGDPRVYYVAGVNEICELAWDGDQWHHWNLTGDNPSWPDATANSPLVAITAGHEPRVYYLARGADGFAVQELAWFNRSWHHRNLNALTGAPESINDDHLAAITIAANGDPRIYYLGPDWHINEFAWYSEDWHFSDITSLVGGAIPGGGTALAVATAHLDPRVYYQGTDRHVHELAWVSSGWATRDVTADTPGTPAAAVSSTMAATTANLDPLSVALADDVAHGTLALDGNGSFVYTPYAGYEGVDRFTYRTSNGWEMSELAEVSIDVAPPAIVLDVDISLYHWPETPQARAPYEEIIGHFADGLYESANSARKLGTVTFYPPSVTDPSPDIYWVSDCHPCASIAGYGSNRGHIMMCDNFDVAHYDFMVDDRHRRGGGYVLAHEWGHYYFGLFDEYELDEGDEPVPDSIMNNQGRAIDEGYKWLNFSVNKNFTVQTRQARYYDACGWETLARPATDDPATAWWNSRPLRTAYRDLQDVAPAAGEDAPLELPGTAQSALNIEWAEPTAEAAYAADAGATYTAHLNSKLGPVITYPKPILLEAWVGREMPLAGLGVQGTVRLPNGSIKPAIFTDDGLPPDAEADDGLYAALLSYSEDGEYVVSVGFDNDAGAAAWVATAFEPSAGPNGEALPLPAPMPMTQALTANTSLSLIVVGSHADDHGNGPATATPVSVNNDRFVGRLDAVDDLGLLPLHDSGR